MSRIGPESPVMSEPGVDLEKNIKTGFEPKPYGVKEVDYYWALLTACQKERSHNGPGVVEAADLHLPVSTSENPLFLIFSLKEVKNPQSLSRSNRQANKALQRLGQLQGRRAPRHEIASQEGQTVEVLKKALRAYGLDLNQVSLLEPDNELVARDGALTMFGLSDELTLVDKEAIRRSASDSFRPVLHETARQRGQVEKKRRFGKSIAIVAAIMPASLILSFLMVTEGTHASNEQFNQDVLTALNEAQAVVVQSDSVASSSPENQVNSWINNIFVVGGERNIAVFNRQGERLGAPRADSVGIYRPGEVKTINGQKMVCIAPNQYTFLGDIDWENNPEAKKFIDQYLIQEGQWVGGEEETYASPSTELNDYQDSIGGNNQEISIGSWGTVLPGGFNPGAKVFVVDSYWDMEQGKNIYLISNGPERPAWGEIGEELLDQGIDTESLAGSIKEVISNFQKHNDQGLSEVESDSTSTTLLTFEFSDDLGDYPWSQEEIAYLNQALPLCSSVIKGICGSQAIVPLSIGQGETTPVHIVKTDSGWGFNYQYNFKPGLFILVPQNFLDPLLGNNPHSTICHEVGHATGELVGGGIKDCSECDFFLNEGWAGMIERMYNEAGGVKSRYTWLNTDKIHPLANNTSSLTLEDVENLNLGEAYNVVSLVMLEMWENHPQAIKQIRQNAISLGENPSLEQVLTWGEQSSPGFREFWKQREHIITMPRPKSTYEKMEDFPVVVPRGDFPPITLEKENNN